MVGNKIYLFYKLKRTKIKINLQNLTLRLQYPIKNFEEIKENFEIISDQT